MAHLSYRFPALLLLRGLVSTIGCLAFVWGLISFPVFWRISEIDTVAAQIIAGAPFRRETLISVLPSPVEGGAFMPSRYWRSIAIVEIAALERGISDLDHPPSHIQRKALETSINNALEQEPSDAYLWLVLFWLRVVETGSVEANVAPLRMSYALGPFEGWIALARSRLALGLFASLPEDIQQKALEEFKLLLTSGYTRQAAEIMAGPGRPLQDRLLDKIAPLPAAVLQRFAAELHALDDSIIVPGVPYRDYHY